MENNDTPQYEEIFVSSFFHRGLGKRLYAPPGKAFLLRIRKRPKKKDDV